MNIYHEIMTDTEILKPWKDFLKKNITLLMKKYFQFNKTHLTKVESDICGKLVSKCNLSNHKKLQDVKKSQRNW